ncbi:MAG: TonB-dependent receptor plug domain-containing protein, partial [Bdellovibrionota bacterium]
MIKKLAVIAALLILHSVQVLAQMPTTEATIIVEAEKISSQEIEASRSAVVLDEVAIKLKRPSSVADILRDIPGIEVVRQGSIGQTTTVFIRGSKSESTLVLIDGAVANDIMAPSSGYDFSNLSPNSIARIEVYRGPQSVRFGAGALGGVINIVTKEGSGPLGLDYLVEGGTYETYRVALGLNGSSRDFNYSLGTEGFKSTGFSAAGSSSSLEKDAASVASVSSKLGYKFNSTTKVEATLRYADAEVDLDRGGDASSDDPNYDS